MSESGLTILNIFHNCITVKDAASHSGYNLQYMRRMLRSGALKGVKIGQMWLIEMDSFEVYLANAESSKDHRFGPK